MWRWKCSSACCRSRRRNSPGSTSPATAPIAMKPAATTTTSCCSTRLRPTRCWSPWVSAGHDPAIIFDPATGQFEEADEGDLPLGVMDDSEYQEHVFRPLKPGEVMFIGTDGVWECPNAAGDPFGKPRLHAAIRQSA